MNESATITNIIIEMLRNHPECVADVASAIIEMANESSKPAATPKKSSKPKHAAKHVKQEQANWYDAFVSENTTVKVKGATVQVTVSRGHADEWHDELRAAGFKWSRNNRNWWAYLDDAKRAEVAKRNIENDNATRGMTPEQRRAYWAERRAARNVA